MDGLKSNDLQAVYYSSVNHKTASEAEKKDVCKRLVGLYTDSKLNVSSCVNKIFFLDTLTKVCDVFFLFRILKRTFTWSELTNNWRVLKNTRVKLMRALKTLLVKIVRRHKRCISIFTRPRH